MVITDSGLCVIESLILMVEKDMYGSTLIKKWRYYPKRLPEEYIICHMQQKEVGDVDAVTYIIHENSYNIMDIKEPKYIIIIITTYGTIGMF